MLISCNKSSNELPPVKSDPVALPIPVLINGTEKFKVILEQNRYNSSDTVNVYVENSGQDTTGVIDSLKFVLEIRTGKYWSYDNAKLSPILRCDTLKGTARRKVFSFYNDKIELNEKNIKVGVLKYNDYSRSYSGLYEHPASSAEFYQDTVYNYSGAARGYVMYNGDAVFHLRVADTAQYEIIGHFEENYFFTGSLTLEDRLITKVSFDSVKTSATTKAPATFDNNSVYDSLSLIHSLSDNVNHIVLKLKK